MPAPLEGIRILDFTRFQQGPYATVMLSDMGAEVIKVEEPGQGDLGRALGAEPDGFSDYFEAYNRNKRSITLNLRSEEGRAIVHKLAARVDVVVENFRPGVMDRLGIGYAALSAINPRIIVASASGAGQRGPLARKPSFDVIGQAMSGAMWAQAGGPPNEPQSIAEGFADQVGAMYLAWGVAMALIARERYGVGQHVDSSLLSGQIGFFSRSYVRSLAAGRAHYLVPGRSPLFRAYRCADDRWLALGILDPKVWPRLCRAIEREDLIEDPRFATPHDRHEHLADLYRVLRDVFASRGRDEWLQRLEAHDVACGPVRDFIEVAADPHVIENEYIVTVEHPRRGPMREPGVPVRLSRTPGRVRSTAPELGQHTEEVLRELGYSWEEIEQLRIKGVI